MTYIPNRCSFVQKELSGFLLNDICYLTLRMLLLPKWEFKLNNYWWYNAKNTLSMTVGQERTKTMAKFFEGRSRLSEYLLVPLAIHHLNIPANISLKTPAVKFKRGEESAIELQHSYGFCSIAVGFWPSSDSALAQQGGIAFIYGISVRWGEAQMVREVKSYKAFVVSDSTLTPEMTMTCLILRETGHSPCLSWRRFCVSSWYFLVIIVLLRGDIPSWYQFMTPADKQYHP